MIRQFSLRAGMLAFTLLMVAALAGQAHAQLRGPAFLKATATGPKTVAPGTPFEVEVTVTIDAPYHIQANPATDGYIATEVKLGAVKGLVAGKTVYPPGMEVKISGDRLSVYEGVIKVMVKVTPDKTLKPGKITLPLTVHYQGCNDTTCYPPTDTETSVLLTVGKPAAPKKPAAL